MNNLNFRYDLREIDDNLFQKITFRKKDKETETTDALLASLVPSIIQPHEYKSIRTKNFKRILESEYPYTTYDGIGEGLIHLLENMEKVFLFLLDVFGHMDELVGCIRNKDKEVLSQLETTVQKITRPQVILPQFIKDQIKQTVDGLVAHVDPLMTSSVNFVVIEKKTYILMGMKKCWNKITSFFDNDKNEDEDLFVTKMILWEEAIPNLLRNDIQEKEKTSRHLHQLFYAFLKGWEARTPGLTLPENYMTYLKDNKGLAL